MKSSIKIALGTDNEPVIEFKVIYSDDIRDQLCHQFQNKLSIFPALCSVSAYNYTDQQDGNKMVDVLTFTPITTTKDSVGNITTPLDSINQIRGIETCIRTLRNHPWTSMCVGGDMVYWMNEAGKEEGKINSVTTYSKELNRRELEQMTTYDLTKVLLAEFDDMPNWRKGKTKK